VLGEGLDVESLPFSLKVLLENLLRTEDGGDITADHIKAIAGWDANATPDQEIQFTPARVIMQDFTGVPCVVDLATMREAMADVACDGERVSSSAVRAALKGLKQSKPSRVVLAVPVGPRDVIEMLRTEVDEAICLAMPEPFIGVGCHYGDFEQTPDEQVVGLLARASRVSPS